MPVLQVGTLSINHLLILTYLWRHGDTEPEKNARTSDNFQPNYMHLICLSKCSADLYGK